MSSVHSPATRDEVRQRIRDFVVPLIGLSDLADDQRLISAHLLDSMAAVQMVDFVERAFGIEVEDADLDVANFDTVSGLTGFVLAKFDRRTGGR
jgi:acyl carrier protein